jgi:hypothetical protein
MLAEAAYRRVKYYDNFGAIGHSDEKTDRAADLIELIAHAAIEQTGSAGCLTDDDRFTFESCASAARDIERSPRPDWESQVSDPTYQAWVVSRRHPVK